MPKSQFARCSPFPAGKTSDVLAEADRHPDFIPHVENPQRPTWVIGSRLAVEQAITSYMAEPAKVKMRKDRILNRKRRLDHRCLVGGIVSWPDSIEMCHDKNYPQERLDALKLWNQKTLIWLRKQFHDNLIAVCIHMDESHPHFHFFVVGDAQRLHPGMKNELVDDTRLVVPADRFVAHKAGLTVWLDDFHVDVGQPCGLQRSLRARPTWRIKDRGTRARLFKIDKALAERPDSDLQLQQDEIWDSEVKTQRPRLLF